MTYQVIKEIGDTNLELSVAAPAMRLLWRDRSIFRNAAPTNSQVATL